MNTPTRTVSMHDDMDTPIAGSDPPAREASTRIFLVTQSAEILTPPTMSPPPLLVALAVSKLPVSSRIEKRAARRKPLAKRESRLGQVEKDFFVNSLDEKLPLREEERDDVLKKHKNLSKNQGRTVDRLRRKFATFHWKVPTWDPLTLDDVQRAEHIRSKISKLFNLGIG